MSCLEKIRPSGAAFPGSITMPASGFRKLDARPQPPCFNHHILTCLSSLRLFVNSPNHRSRSTVTQLCRVSSTYHAWSRSAESLPSGSLSYHRATSREYDWSFCTSSQQTCAQLNSCLLLLSFQDYGLLSHNRTFRLIWLPSNPSHVSRESHLPSAAAHLRFCFV